MIPAMTYPQHIRAVLALGLPLAGSQLAGVALQTIDTLMLGWYAPSALAGVVLGGSLFLLLLLMGGGFATAVAPLVAGAEGQGDTTKARRVTRMAMWLSILAGLLSLPVLLSSEWIFLVLGQDPEISALAGDYMSVLAWAIFPAHAVNVLKSHLAAMERTRTVLYVMLAAVAVNAFGNWVLIFGHLGVPEMGVVGAALASLLMHCATLLFLVVYVQRALPEHALFVRFWRPDWEAFAEVFHLGWPIGLTMVAEIGLFSFSSVMMGWLGEIQLVAHGIALQVTAITFMMHLGLSQAATVRAGRALGRNTITDLRRGAVVALGISATAVVATMVVFFTVPHILVGFFIEPDAPGHAEIIAVGSSLLVASAFFQFGDAFQVMGMGLLRGLQDTRRPMIIAGVAYWIVGAPMAYIFGFVLDFGGVGIWVGLACGLVLAASLLMYRFWLRVLPAIAAEVSARLQIDAGQSRPAGTG